MTDRGGGGGRVSADRLALPNFFFIESILFWTCPSVDILGRIRYGIGTAEGQRRLVFPLFLPATRPQKGMMLWALLVVFASGSAGFSDLLLDGIWDTLVFGVYTIQEDGTDWDFFVVFVVWDGKYGTT